MNTWIAGKDLMKKYHLTKNLFTVVQTWKTLQILIIGMQKEYIKNLIIKPQVIIMVCMFRMILLFANMFENFRNKCIKVYELDSIHFLSAPGLAWQACSKKTEVKLELLIDVDMLVMVEKGIRGGISHAIHRHGKVNNKCMKNYNKNKESSYFQYLDAKNLYGQEMSQKLPVDGFKWKRNILKFNEGFRKNYNEDNDKGNFFQVDIEYPKRLHNLHNLH